MRAQSAAIVLAPEGRTSAAEGVLGVGLVRTAAVRRWIAVACLALMTATCSALPGAPVARAADGDVTFDGRGFGHGRGMGQWGAYGYAVDHGLDYQGILDHFYGGTSSATNAGNPVVGVELLGLRGRDALITGPGLAVNGVALGWAAVRVRSVAGNTVEVLVGDSCGGPWTPWNERFGTRVTVTGDVRLCEQGQIRAYRGSMVVLDGGGFLTTVNTLPVDEYLRGVLPREMPASWGSAGGGRGMEALKAQAVAARSYALSSQWTPYATTCDTTACQVYAGAYTQPDGGAATWIEDGRTDAAVAATAGQVRRWGNGAVAPTEFSASTGAWTAGGDFPAVEDLGDGIAANPNRSWSVTLDRADIATRLGIPEINDIRVSERNGLGADGGRVLRVVVDTTDGERTFTGTEVRRALGLKSDWFTLATP
jgi:SpoIID/LytB domain protein